MELIRADWSGEGPWMCLGAEGGYGASGGSNEQQSVPTISGVGNACAAVRLRTLGAWLCLVLECANGECRLVA
jgi:hypothetical protein